MNQQSQQVPEKLRVNLAQAPWLKCSDGNMTFESKLMFKKLSALVSPTGKQEEVPLEMIICSKCGKVPSFFAEKAKDIPAEMISNCTF